MKDEREDTETGRRGDTGMFSVKKFLLLMSCSLRRVGLLGADRVPVAPCLPSSASVFHPSSFRLHP